MDLLLLLAAIVAVVVVDVRRRHDRTSLLARIEDLAVKLQIQGLELEVLRRARSSDAPRPFAEDGVAAHTAAMLDDLLAAVASAEGAAAAARAPALAAAPVPAEPAAPTAPTAAAPAPAAAAAAPVTPLPEHAPPLEGPARTAAGPGSPHFAEVSSGSAASGHEEAAREHDVEVRIGTTWTLRIGLGAIAVAAALYARTVLPGLEPAAKVALAYLGAMLVFAIGWRLEGRLERFARPMMAAGLALGFFVAYAAHFVPAMRAVPLAASLVWMAAGVVAVLVLATRWRSQATAVVAIGLGHVAAHVASAEASAFSLVALAFLSLTAVVLSVRLAWLPLTVFAMTAAYGSHLAWAVDAQTLLPRSTFMLANLAFLATYYGLFLVADLAWWRRRGASVGDAVNDAAARVLGPLNVLALLGVAWLMLANIGMPRPYVVAISVTVALVQAVLARVLQRLGHPEHALYPVLATLLIAVAALSAFDGAARAAALAGVGLALLIAAHHGRVRLTHRLAHLVLVSAFLLAVPEVLPGDWIATLLLGSVAAVLVTAALIEERGWAAGAAVVARGRGVAPLEHLGEGLDAFVAPALRVIAPVHAVAGAILLARALLGVGVGEPILSWAAVALILLPALAAAAWARSSNVLLASWTVLVLAVLFQAVSVPAAHAAWAFAVAAAAVVPAVLLVRARAGRWRSDALWSRWAAQLGLWAAVAAAAGLAAPTRLTDAWSLLHYLLWIALAGVAFLTSDGGRRRDGSAAPDDLTAGPGATAAAAATAVFASILVLMVSEQALMGTRSGPLALGAWLAAWSAAAWAWARRRDRLAPHVGAFVLLTGAFAAAAIGLQAGHGQPLALALVLAVPLAIAVAEDRTAADPGQRRRLGLTSSWAYAFVVMLTALALEAWGVPTGLLPAALMGLVVALVAGGIAFGLRRAATGAWVLALVAVVLHVTLVLSYAQPPLAAGAAIVLVLLAVERALRRPWRGWDGAPSWVTPALVSAACVVALVSTNNAVEFSRAWTTAGWSLVAAAVLTLGFMWRSATYRRAGLVLFAITLTRVFAVDVRSLSGDMQTVAFLTLGVCLVAVAWLYARFATDLRKWL
jgi:hypothetical protein